MYKSIQNVFIIEENFKDVVKNSGNGENGENGSNSHGFSKFINDNKKNIAMGAAGLVGAAGLGFAGNELGQTHGESQYQDDLENTQTEIENQQLQAQNTQTQLQKIQNFNPEEKILLDKYLLKGNIPNTEKEIVDYYNKRLAETPLGDKANLLLDNRNALITQLQDTADNNLHLYPFSKEVGDYAGNIKNPSVYNIFQNDDLNNPSSQAKAFESKIEKIRDRAEIANALEDNLKGNDDLTNVNKARQEALLKQSQDNLKEINQNITNNEKKLEELQKPDTINNYQKDYAKKGLLTGGIVGAGAGIYGVHKLNNYLQNRRENQERIDNLNKNIYGEDLPNSPTIPESPLTPIPSTQNSQNQKK